MSHNQIAQAHPNGEIKAMVELNAPYAFEYMV